ncbi:MAG: hypothetical protein ACREI7_08510, partial [Myxococcota bacterium]
MNTRFVQRRHGVLAGAAVALFVAACSSTPDPGSDKGTFTGSEFREAPAAIPALDFASGAEPALARAAPGEEIWVISRPRGLVPDADTRDDAEPGSGAMLAS